jgi:hypothetical protein
MLSNTIPYVEAIETIPGLLHSEAGDGSPAFAGTTVFRDGSRGCCSNEPYTRFSRNVVSSGTGRPVAPLDAPLFHAVPAMSRWAQV